MENLRWEDIGEWLEGPKADGSGYFKHKDGRKVYVLGGFTIPGTCILDSHENIEKRFRSLDKSFALVQTPLSK